MVGHVALATDVRGSEAALRLDAMLHGDRRGFGMAAVGPIDPVHRRASVADQAEKRAYTVHVPSIATAPPPVGAGLRRV